MRARSVRQNGVRGGSFAGAIGAVFAAAAAVAPALAIAIAITAAPRDARADETAAAAAAACARAVARACTTPTTGGVNAGDPCPAATLAPPPPAPGGVPDYDTVRYEPAGFPLVGGNSDIGLQVGAVGTITRFGRGIRPYEYNLDIVLSTSFKAGPHGVELAQENYFGQLDAPGLWGGRIRLNPAIAYQRTINRGYYGLGDAPAAVPPPGADARYFQYVAEEARLRQLSRFVLARPVDAMIISNFRYENPSSYPGSKLATDAPHVYGLGRLGLVTLGGGLVYDTRDNEVFPRRGSFHQIAAKATLGVPADAEVRYVETSAILATYVPIHGPFVFAGRLLGDVQMGHVPFYDLSTGGPFITLDLPGGSGGVRGVPAGRYAGLVKVVANAEIRAMLVDFRLLGQSFHFGGNVFVDTGRVWNDLTFKSSPGDHKWAGLAVGAGAGAYVLWGQAAVFRVEVAYSPDAVAENPTLPVGIYVEDGVMF